MNKLKFILCSLIALITIANAIANGYVIATDNLDTYIFNFQNASILEEKAGIELQSYLKKISDQKIVRYSLPIVHFKGFYAKNFPEIVICTLETGKDALPEKVKKRLSEAHNDSFYIFNDDKRLTIAGKTQYGALYGVYAFLEKYLNVRYFHPGEAGINIPKQKNIKLPKIDWFSEPDVTHRVVSHWKLSILPYTMEETEKFMLFNRLTSIGEWRFGDNSIEKIMDLQAHNNSLTGGGHLTFEISIPKSLFKTKPELFPLQNGKRVCNERSQRCLSNPEVQKKVIDFISEYTKYYPGFRISYHDSTDGWCECDGCKKLGDVNGTFSITDMAHRFVKIVSDEVLKRNPNARLTTMLYSQFRELPLDKSFKYDPRIVGIYCPHQRCYVHAMNSKDSNCNNFFNNEYLLWKNHCSSIGIFDYYDYASSPYAPMEYTLGEDIKYYVKNGMDLFIDDCTNKNYNGFYSNWPFYYLLSKLLWNSKIDVEKTLDEAYRMYYGNAADVMKKYHALRRELWESAKGHAVIDGAFRIANCLSDANSEGRLKGYLDSAEKLVAKDKILLKRIKMDRDCLNDFWVKEANKIKKLQGNQKNIEIAETISDIVIDGNLNEDSWRKVRANSDFVIKNEEKLATPKEETRVKVLYDKDNLYIGIEAMTEHAWSKLIANEKNKDGKVWQDDSVEIFLAPNGDNYYQIVVNSIGVVYDAMGRDSSFNADIELKTKVNKDSYVVEMKIPIKTVKGVIVPGQAWQMHFARNCRNLQPPTSNEFSSLGGIAPHIFTQFRKAFFGKNVFANGNFNDVAKHKNNKIISELFPKGWYGNNVEWVNNTIKVKTGGVLYHFFGRLDNLTVQNLNGSIRLKGKGKIIVWLSTCIRKYGEKTPFKHDKRTVVIEENLTGEEQIITFSEKLAVDEIGYLFMQVIDEATIYEISGVLTD